ncbi:MAG: hypothetical protein GY757_46205 [bacterium]|nr:hypothetical protein [bacterium]
MATIAEQWVEEGEKKGRWAMVMNLLKEGLPMNIISKASGFSADEINRRINNPPKAAANI